MVVPEVPHGQPQVLLGNRAEDLGRGALVLGLLGAEMDPPAPYPILGAPQGEANGDTLSFESNGGKIVNDCFAYCRGLRPCRLCGHADPVAGLGKDYMDL
jgi:hypothetical protein